MWINRKGKNSNRNKLKDSGSNGWERCPSSYLPLAQVGKPVVLAQAAVMVEVDVTIEVERTVAWPKTRPKRLLLKPSGRAKPDWTSRPTTALCFLSSAFSAGLASSLADLKFHMNEWLFFD